MHFYLPRTGCSLDELGGTSLVLSSNKALMATGTENIPGRKSKGTLDAESEARGHDEMPFSYSSSDLDCVMTLINLPSLVQGFMRAVIMSFLFL